MDIRKIKLLLNTVKYLKPIQVYYRFYYFFRNRFFSREAGMKTVPIISSIKWESKLKPSVSYIQKTNSFSFINISHIFSRQIDWNYASYGKLWTYNLNYFDFLNQEGMSKENGLYLINDYVKNDTTLKDGKEPYPISLRGINWVKFLSENAVKDSKIDKILYHHYYTLLKNLEYHLLGNHLLENAFSLLFGAYYFQDEKLYVRSKKLLISELDEQVLKDGAHFELSPMYHQILFHRLLDCIQLIKLNSSWKKDELITFLEEKASLMNTWLKNITYSNGNIPMVNDATFNIAAKSDVLLEYAKYLKIKTLSISLKDSGYRKITSTNYELLIDVGNVGSEYQPGHAHSDTFNFELIKKGNPIFVDTGISTYEKNEQRQRERDTSSHNTVEINHSDQTHVWGGFRVAKRAKIINLLEQDNFVEATHDGYKSQGFLHKRSFQWYKDEIVIKDDTALPSKNKARAFFHLHSSIEKPTLEGNKIALKKEEITINFNASANIEIKQYILSHGFNKTKTAYKIIVTFDQNLVTTISL